MNKRMGASINILSLCLFPFMLLAQQNYRTPREIRDHRNASESFVYRMDTLVPCINDGLFDQARQNQGVIGNDFNGSFQIGMAQNDNSYSYTATDYQPVDGYKRTFTGMLERMKYMDSTDDVFKKDDDINYVIKVDPNNELLKRHKNNLMRANYPNDGRPWNIIFGEIDIHREFHKFYKHPYTMPRPNADSISMHGPWVLEIYDPQEGSYHANFHEIHPAEQIWWVIKSGKKKTYNLLLASDNSGRFNGRKDYTEYGSTRLVNLWQNNPFHGTFAIPIKVNPISERLSFKIKTIAQKNVKKTPTTSKYHFLVHKKDTIATIQFDGDQYVSLSFQNIGFDPPSYWENPKTSIINGFMVLKATITSNSDYAGNLRLEVIEDRKIKAYKPSMGKIF